MIEERSTESFTNETVSLTTTENNAIANNTYDFERYEPYVEKIRSLFVPSLEPRIHSCLETFVYSKDKGQLSPCLKRCLEMAAAWCEPFDAFCTKWGDEGFLENVLGQGIKYLIKDGLVDCFLNSIILNNRLNKVCRDLDGLGIDRDLLRYLTVWNYMNERDYWIDNDQRIPMSMPHRSYDSVDRPSDLDVEIGSNILNDRNVRVPKRSLKRRATEDSSEELPKNNGLSGNFRDNDRSSLRPQSWLGIDSRVQQESKSNDGKKSKRSISQTLQCRPSNCPIYRMKNSSRGDWEGKILKLKISEACSTVSKCEPLESLDMSKLRLPCKFEDLVPKIMKTDSALAGLFSISRRKKFQAGVINICHRINEILREIDKNEVRRCRLHCEIFPAHLSFRMIQRESNGRKVCLLTDRVVFNKIEAKSQSASRGSSFSQLSQIAENEDSRESGLTIYESARADDSLQRIPTSPELNCPQGEFESKILTNSKELNCEDHLSNKNRTEDQVCRCDDSLDHVVDHFDHETRDNQESNHVQDYSSKIKENNSKELTREESLMPSSTLEDQTCACNTSLDVTSHQFVDKMENNRKTDDTDYLGTDREPDDRKELFRKESLLQSTLDTFDNQACLCNRFFDDKLDPFDRKAENNSKEPTPKASLIQSMENPFDNQECLCGTSFENPPARSDLETQTLVNSDDCVECPAKSVQDVPESNCQNSKDSSFVPIFQKIRDNKNERTSDLMVQHPPVNDLEVTKTRSVLTCSKSIANSPDTNNEEIPRVDIACACPSDCTCQNKEILDQAADCDSECSCDSCDDPDPTKSLTTQTSHNMDVFNQVPSKKSESLITERVKPHCIEKAQSKVIKKPETPIDQLRKSLVSLKSVPTKILSRPFVERDMKRTKTDHSDRDKFQASSVQRSGRSESKKKLPCRGSPIISARLPRSKGQRINISIELCPESESSREKITKDVPTLPNVSKKLENFRHIESKVLPSSGEIRCRSVDCGNSEIRVNLPEKNTRDEFSGGLVNARVHSPPRPLEFRDCVPPTERASSLRNSYVCENPIKSSTRSGRKLERRSMSRETRIPRNYETTEFSRPIANNRCCEKNNYEHERSGRNESRSPRNSPRLPIINGHLCHAFSASSVDRMRHIIKTKLRRILLERDKSTNTPKTSLTNKKYRVSVPNGKTERSPFCRKYCRTIWESQSASDSTRTSRSLVPEDRTGIRDREQVTHLLYSSARSKVSSSKFESVSPVSDFSKNTVRSIVSRRNLKIHEPSELDSMKNCSRLAGGSDFVSRENELGSGEFLASKNQRSQFTSVEMENQFSPGRRDRKLGGKSVNCDFYEIFDDNSRPLNIDDFELSRKISEQELIHSARKLDSSLNSTSRHIYLHEFPQFESSNDELLRSRVRRVRERSKNKISYSEHCEEQPSKKKSMKVKKVCGKNARDSRTTRLAPRRDKIELKNSSSNADTTNPNQKGFSYLDHDLRSKLSQYVSLCKSVKYSLLKRLRPEVLYEVSTSVSCGDRYKFGNS